MFEVPSLSPLKRTELVRYDQTAMAQAVWADSFLGNFRSLPTDDSHIKHIIKIHHQKVRRHQQPVTGLFYNASHMVMMAEAVRDLTSRLVRFVIGLVILKVRGAIRTDDYVGCATERTYMNKRDTVIEGLAGKTEATKMSTGRVFVGEEPHKSSFIFPPFSLAGQRVFPPRVCLLACPPTSLPARPAARLPACPSVCPPARPSRPCPRPGSRARSTVRSPTVHPAARPRNRLRDCPHAQSPTCQATCPSDRSAVRSPARVPGYLLPGCPSTRPPGRSVAQLPGHPTTRLPDHHDDTAALRSFVQDLL